MKVGVDKQFVTKVIAVAKIIDELDYYKILSVPTNATLGQIRQAYHKQSRIFHPDRYFHVKDETFKKSVYMISKRVTEAYVTLRDSGKRSFYDKQLQQSKGKKLRYDEQSEHQKKQEKKQQIGKTENGRKMYQQGMKEFKAKKFADAERSFKMAMAYEPDNELFKKMADEAGRNIKVDYRIK